MGAVRQPQNLRPLCRQARTSVHRKYLGGIRLACPVPVEEDAERLVTVCPSQLRAESDKGWLLSTDDERGLASREVSR